MGSEVEVRFSCLAEWQVNLIGEEIDSKTSTHNSPSANNPTSAMQNANIQYPIPVPRKTEILPKKYRKAIYYLQLSSHWAPISTVLEFDL